MLSPKIDFRFIELMIEGARVVVLEIDPAFHHPLQFKNQEFIRVGSYKKRLKEFPEKERDLWRTFERVPFERLVAAENMSDDEVLAHLDYQTYFDLLNLSLPDGHKAILNALRSDGILNQSQAGGWDITNLGVVLFAKRLQDFPGIRRKAIRVIKYEGNGRISTNLEQEGARGYGSGFSNLIDFIKALIPTNEVIEQAIRRTVPMFPEIAIRELVANALIHQDFLETGTGPMIEIFDDRIEITNPGVPLVDTNRFVDTPPRSRNEMLASMMRRFAICEERGSGIDKVISQVELYQLPAPLFEVIEGHTRVTLFAHKPLTSMTKDDRVRACYLHACLKYVMREQLTNASLRMRFGIEDQNKAAVSRYIKEAVDEGMIKAFDESASRKFMKYVPFWA